jgi:hypothetical protein
MSNPTHWIAGIQIRRNNSWNSYCAALNDKTCLGLPCDVLNFFPTNELKIAFDVVVQ